MALYAFDGTGNDDRDGELNDSNVLRFFLAYDDPDKDLNPDEDAPDPTGSIYIKGIGQKARTLVGDKVAEAFGFGGHFRIRQAMRRLRNNIKANAQEKIQVDIVGFSRGAGLAISFANEIHEEYGDEVTIRFIGLWDTVGQFGLPGRRLQFGHDLHCPKNVTRCYHAMAIDENRLLFPLTRLQEDGPIDGVIEAWFRGVHSDVGGGNGNRPLNAVSLHWMFMAAQRAGLPIAQQAIDGNLALRRVAQPVKEHGLSLDAKRKPGAHGLLHTSVPQHGGPGLDPAFLGLHQIDDAGAVSKPQTV